MIATAGEEPVRSPDPRGRATGLNMQDQSIARADDSDQANRNEASNVHLNAPVWIDEYLTIRASTRLLVRRSYIKNLVFE